MNSQTTSKLLRVILAVVATLGLVWAFNSIRANMLEKEKMTLIKEIGATQRVMAKKIAETTLKICAQNLTKEQVQFYQRELKRSNVEQDSLYFYGDLTLGIKNDAEVGVHKDDLCAPESFAMIIHAGRLGNFVWPAQNADNNKQLAKVRQEFLEEKKNLETHLR